ncbi:HAMP domain-containing protein [Ilyomonas limi]|uniref:histidine kinase n=1 Tax=Ilyomonas limi TaxID=2575867 RepID=A0A4U3KXS5_9BACT|nr:HAMP domain-containing sensor histidine kinase [Ilyomonas limi]TKK67435.1 HAMP domain-containing protein [Ilyomonas limi]
MFFTLKTKIWLTILSIVLMFTFFTLIYFPAQQGNFLYKNYNNEVQNLANTVALGVQIALDDQNYKAVQTAMEYVKGNPGLKFVSLVQKDTVWDATHTKPDIKEMVFKTFPDNAQPLLYAPANNDSIIIKRAPFNDKMMSGEIVLGFTTKEIEQSKKNIRTTSLIVSAFIFLIGLFIGLLLSRKISKPVIALRNAARKVGEGDLTQRVQAYSNDEIGDLTNAFNTMVIDLSKTRNELRTSNRSLLESNAALSNTLNELKATQAQLIQSEKMASLGELTAGIAHEIQNPLNFVNNFSEVSIELAEELKEALQQLADTTQLHESITTIADDLIQNQQKINYHGKRADAIVKGMLQHSRKSTGQKELTDINQLADEYLRLSYHGLRAKDKTFNAAIQTYFDENLQKINVIPQDIGRVLLNLYTNAFYAVTKRKKALQSPDKSARVQPESKTYEPTVTVTTKNIFTATPGADSPSVTGIEIHVRDNGNGISAEHVSKIFQPFFTTKPTGEGTGLGLSLSYDIITKGHGGTLTVQSQEGEYAEFIITLPVG